MTSPLHPQAINTNIIVIAKGKGSYAVVPRSPQMTNTNIIVVIKDRRKLAFLHIYRTLPSAVR